MVKGKVKVATARGGPVCSIVTSYLPGFGALASTSLMVACAATPAVHSEADVASVLESFYGAIKQVTPRGP
jgi:hypothetical protein